jgi:hypothetical protein
MIATAKSVESTSLTAGLDPPQGTVTVCDNDDTGSHFTPLPAAHVGTAQEDL